MKPVISVIVLSVLMAACSRDIYSKLPELSYKYIKIDSTYTYFIREVYADESGRRYEIKSAAEAGAGTGLRLIEVEYLLISGGPGNNVLYFTTIPDRRQMLYSEGYKGSKYINIADVRMLHFGKRTGTDGKLFLFSYFKPGETDTWQTDFNTTQTELTVKTITEVTDGRFNSIMPVDSALQFPVVLKKTEPYFIVHYRHKVKKDTDTTGLKENKIYYKNEQPRRVIFVFNRSIRNNNNAKEYNNKRIVYDPELIFK